MNYKATGAITIAIIIALALMGGCKKPWSEDGSFTERIISHIDDRVKELQLTEEQNAKYEQIKLQMKTNIEEFIQDREVFLGALKIEISKERPDLNMVAENVKLRMKDLADFGGDNVDLFMEFYGILDETQQTQVIETIQEKVERREKCGFRW